MPSPSRVYKHVFAGGLATDLGTFADVGPNARGTIEVPFLLRADNIYFGLDGSVRKIGGTSKYNSSAIVSGQEIRGMYEYIRQGTAGSPARKRIVLAGTKIQNDDNDGSFVDLFTGLTDNSVPCFTVFEDELIISTDANEAPMSWDQTTAAALAGSPPNFAFSTVHVNRVWAAGDPAAPSTVYYSSLENGHQWNGVGNSGTIAVDPNDGDVVTAVVPYRGELIVFKGPNYGSIHRISGTTPSDFSRKVLTRGVGAVWQNMVFPLGTDLGFVGPNGTIRTLLATDQFGDYNATTLSREIEQWLSRTTYAYLKRGWAVPDPVKGYVLFTYPIDSSQVPNATLMMDMRFGKPRFAPWPAITAWSLARMSDSSNSNQLIVYAGGNDGYVRKLQQATRAVDTSTAIAAYAQTPFIDYGTPYVEKTLKGVGLGMNPKGSYSVTFSFRHAVQGTLEIDQQGGAILGSFVLDVDMLGGDSHVTTWSEEFESGQFREISYEVSNIIVNEDFEVQAIHTVLEGSRAESLED